MMSSTDRLTIVDQLIPMLGQIGEGIEVGTQARKLFACLAQLKAVSHWTLGHTRAAIRLRALAAGIADAHARSGVVDPDALERMRGTFLELRNYVAADATGARTDPPTPAAPA